MPTNAAVIVFLSLSLSLLGFPGGSEVNNLPAMQEPQKMRVQSLDREGPLEEDMASHSSILTWRIPWTEEPGGLQMMGSQRVGHDGATNTTLLLLAKRPG